MCLFSRAGRTSVAVFLSILLLPIGLSSNQANAAPLEWIAGDLPPFVWQSPQGPQGLAYELADKMSAKIGRPMALSFYPWARAVRMTQVGTHYGVFPLARTPDREAQFRWLIPLAHVDYTFFGRATDSFDLNGLEALRGLRIGVLRGSPIIKNLQAENFRDLVEAKDYKDLLRMLTEGIVAAVYAGEPMLRAAMEEFKFKPQDFRSGMSLKSAGLYMATSITLDSVEAELWLQAYRDLQADGTLARLQKKYLQRMK
jgi:polar amino acid transport system substrate-binding protein